jgi:hypothetical protein
MLSGKTGRTIGISSIAAPIIGYVINDLKKPDSVVRGLIGGVVRRLLPGKTERVEAIDITEDAEIIDSNSAETKQLDHND